MTDPTNDQSESDTTSVDRFVDALLTHKYADTELAMERRISSALRSVRGERSRRNAWQWWALPIAAILAVSFLVIPTASSASALVRSATRVARLASDRRYEVVMIPVARNVGDSPPPIHATLDIRDEQHMRLEIRFPDGRLSERGRDGGLSWERGPNGVLKTDSNAKPWPRWIETPDGSLLIDSMASILDGLDQTYDLRRVANTQCGGQSGLVQIDARRKSTAATDAPPSRANPAQEIMICIDPDSNEVIRLAMLFDTPPSARRGEHGPPDGARGPPPHGERGAPPPHGALPPPGPPQSLSFSRADLTSFPEGWFNTPSAK